MTQLSTELFPLLWTVLVACVAGLALRWSSWLRSTRGVLLLGVASTAAVMREEAPAYTVSTLLLFSVTRLLSPRSGGDRHSRERSWKLTLWALFSLTVLFVVARHLGASKLDVRMLGGEWKAFSLDMWAFLRFATCLWEVGSGRVKDLSAATFFAWAFLPFTSRGPILRLSEFVPLLSSLSSPATGQSSYPAAPARTLVKALLWLAAAMALSPLFTELSARVPASFAVLPKALSIFFVGPWSFLLSFGGYCLAMEGAAGLAGLTLPPSFQGPFGKRNIADFWASWNMSATRVFRDYLFMVRWGMRVPNPYLNSIVVFTACGLWHASNAYWIGWGFLHGVAFAGFLWLKQHRSRSGRTGPLLPYWLAAALTYLFVCLLWYIPSKILQLLGWT